MKLRRLRRQYRDELRVIRAREAMGAAARRATIETATRGKKRR